jgi:hypothetical protein
MSSTLHPHPAILNMEIRFRDTALCPVRTAVIVNQSSRLEAPRWEPWHRWPYFARRGSIIVVLAVTVPPGFQQSPVMASRFRANT